MLSRRGGDVDAVAEDVVAVGQHIADIDTDAVLEPLVGWPGVRGGHAPLHRDGAAHGIDGTRELDQQAVAGGLDDAAPMLGYFGIGEVTANRPQCCERAGRMTTTRRLAAILAADVAGYSRLMGADEEGVNAGCNSNMRWMASRASCSRPRWAQATALQRYT